MNPATNSRASDLPKVVLAVVLLLLTPGPVCAQGRGGGGQGMSVQLGNPWITGGQGAFLGTSAPTVPQAPAAAVPMAPTGNLSPGDMMRLQQARNAHSSHVRDMGKYGKYGKAAENMERMDQMFADKAKYLSEYDYYNMSGKLTDLKEQVARTISQGGSEDQFLEPLKLLEDNATVHINESIESIEREKQAANDNVKQLEKEFSSQSKKMSESDRSDLESKIKELKQKAQHESISQPGTTTAVEVTRSCKEIQAAIQDRTAGPTVLSGLGDQSSQATSDSSGSHAGHNSTDANPEAQSSSSRDRPRPPRTNGRLQRPLQ